jgi:hypothetical protein
VIIRAAMKEFLEPIVRNQLHEARWLNTLSLLEYIGARKIGKTFSKFHPSIDILEHHADETRHAYGFKRLSIILAGGTDCGYLCSEAAIDYFQELDKKLTEWILRVTQNMDTFQNYLIVTAVIERRAMKLYPLYRKMTSNGLVREELKRVIEEESSHKRSIEEECLKILNRNDVPDFEECDQIEEQLFQIFAETLKQAMS